MSTDEYESNYFSDEPASNEGYTQTAPEQQAQPAETQQTGPSIEQLTGVIQQLQSELANVKANPLASLGYQPIQQQGRFNNEDPAVKEAREFLQAQGVLTKESLTTMLADEAREESAVNAGFENSQHLAANFWNEFYSTNSPQTKAELQNLYNLYESGSKANIAKAVKGFKDYQERKQSGSIPAQSQTFGRVPQNQPAQQSPVPRFKSANEFNGWLRTQDPVKQRQVMMDWQAGKIPDPF